MNKASLRYHLSAVFQEKSSPDVQGVSFAQAQSFAEGIISDLRSLGFERKETDSIKDGDKGLAFVYYPKGSGLKGHIGKTEPHIDILCGGSVFPITLGLTHITMMDSQPFYPWPQAHEALRNLAKRMANFEPTLAEPASVPSP